MPPIRNSCVARGRITTAGQVAVYTVPANLTLILKSLLADFPGGATGNIGWILGTSGTLPTPYLHQASLTTTVPDHYQTWICLNATDILYLNTSAVPLDYWISGALLPSVSGF